MSGIIKQQGSAGDSGKVSESTSSRTFVGMIQSFAMTSAPKGWLLCDGTAVSRTTYLELFTVVGTTWGAGDGSSTFTLPKLAGAFLRGNGNATAQMGNTNVYQGGNIGTMSNDMVQDTAHGSQSNLIKVGGPQYIAGFSGRTIGAHAFAFRTGYFHYDHTQGGTSPYSSQFAHHGGITDGGGDGSATAGGTIRALGETKPFSASVEYMIFSGVGV